MALSVDKALRKAQSHLKAGELAEAEALYKEVLSKFPKNKKAIPEYQKLKLGITSSTSEPPQEQVQKLISLYNQQQFEAVLSKVEPMTGLFPKAIVLFNIQGACNSALQRHDSAIDSYKQALKIKPDYADAYNNMGIALKDKGDLEAAIDSYKQALKIKPDYADAYNNMGNALRENGEPEAAIDSYKQALKIKPDYAEAYNNMGNALKAKGDLEAALDSYKQALKIKPDYAEAHYNLYPLLLDPDDMTPSIKCMKRAVGIKPSGVDFSFVLGMLLDYSGKPQEAKPYFDTVKNGAARDRAKLDAWHYIKSAKDNVPTMIGSRIQAYKLGIDAAIIEGLVLEFGVRFGTSIRQIASLVKQDVHGFDSFEGLPEAWDENPPGSYSTKGVIPSVPHNVTLHDGWFEETLPGFVKKHPAPVRFMNIDCDIYSSTKTVLEIFAKQIIPGTVIVFDEYIGNKNWREDEFKAFQEAVLKHGWEYEYLCFSFMTNQVVVRLN